MYYEPTPRDGRCGEEPGAGRLIREPGAAQGLGAGVAAALVAGVLGCRPSVALGRAGSGAAAAAGASPAPQARASSCPRPRPHLPAGSTQLGAAPGGQVLDLDVVLAGQDPAGLAQAVVDAVSTPGSPDYRHYLTAAQYAAQFGPSPAEVAQVSSALRAEGLTVGTPEPGSTLLPVSGTASVVSAALGTPLVSVQAPGESARAVVNTASPQIPASLDGVVTGVVGLDGLFQEHSMIKQGHGGTSGSRGIQATEAPESQPAAGATGTAGQNPAAIAHAGTPQACAAAQATAFDGTYTSTQLASLFGLDQLFGQGRTGIGQSIAIVEFEQYAASDVAAFQACYGLSNPVRNVVVDGGAGGPPQGGGEAALDTELAAVNAPSASLVVYEAPNGDDAQAFDLFNRIASDDSSQVVTTSWGVCEADMPGSRPADGERHLPAHGPAGADRDRGLGRRRLGGLLSDQPLDQALAVDDPGSQPDVVSAGGTALPSASASSQSVWNDCQGSAPSCAGNSSFGAAGGGYSIEWPANPGQPAAVGAEHHPLRAEHLPGGTGLLVPVGPLGGRGGRLLERPLDGLRWHERRLAHQRRALRRHQSGLLQPARPCRPRALRGAAGQQRYVHRHHAGQQRLHQHQPRTVRRHHRLRCRQRARHAGRPEPGHRAAGRQTDARRWRPSAPISGPVNGAGAITILGGGFANAHVGQLRVGRARAASWPSTATSVTVVPPDAPGPECVDVTVGNSQGISATSRRRPLRVRRGPELRRWVPLRGVRRRRVRLRDAGFYGSAGGTPLNAPVVGMADTPSSNGYWLVASDGGIFTYGDARFFGSMGGRHLNKPIVGMAATPDGGGYWLVASDGGIFSFGDAVFYGSTGGTTLNKPIVGMAAHPTAAATGWSPPTAASSPTAMRSSSGRPAAIHLNSPVVGMAAGPNGDGYWLVAADGGIFTYGSATFFGSAGSLHLNKPVVGMAASAQRRWVLAGRLRRGHLLLRQCRCSSGRPAASS